MSVLAARIAEKPQGGGTIRDWPMRGARCTFVEVGVQCAEAQALVLLEERADGWRTLCEPHRDQVAARRRASRRWPWA